MECDVAVVIVTYNSSGVICDLLDSLPRALDGLAFDVVVVDNGSTDDTLTRLAMRTDCKTVQSTNDGYAAGINKGRKAVKPANAVLVLNPDVRLREGSVAPLYEALADATVGIVAPKVLDDDGGLSFSLRREPTLLRALGLARTRIAALSEYVNRAEAYETGRRVDWAMGAALLISNKCQAAVGDWDETYFLYSEETDYCLRARDQGFATIYEPRSVVWHIGGQSGRNDATHAMQILNRTRFYSRHHGRASSWLYYLLTLLSELAWIGRGHPQSRFAVRALLRPKLRPAQLGLNRAVLPR